MEAEFWKWKGTYKYIDTMICCSEFMKSKMDSNPLFATKTVAMHNFIDKVEWKETEKKDYVLYFGRFSEEKGIGTLPLPQMHRQRQTANWQKACPIH